MDIIDAAFYLLILRIISSVALLWVIWKQIGYLKLNQPPEEQKIRIGLTILTLILLGGNIIPIWVDLLTLSSDIERSTRIINSVGIAYTFSNATFAALAGIAWGTFYWFAERERVHLKKDIHDLHQEVEDLHQDAADVKTAQGVKDIKSAKDLKNAKAAPSNSKKA